MGAIATFNYQNWLESFPEFLPPPAGTGPPEVMVHNTITIDVDGTPTTVQTGYFGAATNLLANDGSGPVSDPGQQLYLLNLLTAHIAKLFWVPAGQQPSGLVGRISAATEGSVNVTIELPQAPFAAAWYLQTQYGLTFWSATAFLRTMRYRAPLCNNPAGVFPFGTIRVLG